MRATPISEEVIEKMNKVAKDDELIDIKEIPDLVPNDEVETENDVNLESIEGIRLEPGDIEFSNDQFE